MKWKNYEKNIDTIYFSLSLPFISGVGLFLIYKICPYSIKKKKKVEEEREKEKKEKE